MIGLVCPDDCPCEPPTCDTTVNVTVTGCTSGVRVPGAPVSITLGGSTIASGTTNSSGEVTLTPTSTPGASATLVIGAVLGYAGTSVGITLDCGTVNRTVGLIADADHICVHCCNHPIPRVLKCMTVAGEITLTYGGSITQWGGTIDVTTSKLATCASATCTCQGQPVIYRPITITSGTTRIAVQLRCRGDGTWEVLTGMSILYGRTSCDGDLDWGFADDSCVSGITQLEPQRVDRETLDSVTGSCASGVVALSGTVTDPASFNMSDLFDSPICAATSSGTVTAGPANPLAGTITFYNP